MADVLVLGKGDCTIRVCDDWWLIGSNVSWLEHPTCSLPDLFRTVVPSPGHGQHSMRGDVLLGAFARNIAVLRDQTLVHVQGVAPSPVLMARANDMREALFFQM